MSANLLNARKALNHSAHKNIQNIDRPNRILRVKSYLWNINNTDKPSGRIARRKTGSYILSDQLAKNMRHRNHKCKMGEIWLAEIIFLHDQKETSSKKLSLFQGFPQRN